jgi:biotin transport system substrate-specific component
VVAGSSADKFGMTYMMGGTGGYLVGYVLATLAVGALAAKGWDRSPAKMTLALLIANVLIYVPGLAWLSTIAPDWATTLQWGLTPYLIGDAVKLALVALLLPLIWKMVGAARG